MTTAEQNYLLLQEIEANRRFLLMAYQQNPKLLKNAEARIKQMFEVTAPREPDEVNPAGMRKQRGVSLIELIMFIVIISVAVTGILLVMNKVTGHSADTLIRKQSLAIAESLLEEVELMPFTYCDPDDANAANATAATAAQCPAASGVGGVETMGPETLSGTETRYAAPNFDNVNDYHGFVMNAGNGGIKDITYPTNPAIAALGGYSASVSVVPQALGGIAGTDINGAPQSLLVTVNVTGPDNVPVTLEGYRTRYAPRDVP